MSTRTQSAELLINAKPAHNVKISDGQVQSNLKHYTFQEEHFIFLSDV